MDKKFTFQLYQNNPVNFKPDIKADTVSIMWPANDQQGAEDRMFKWMERSSKLRVNKSLDGWTGIKLLEETA